MTTQHISSKVHHLINLVKWIPQAKTLDTLDSPYLFQFAKEVVWKTSQEPKIINIESRRAQFLKDDSEIEDFGSGTFIESGKTRSIAQIAKSAVSDRKKCSLLYNIIQFLRPSSILELGTSLGISTLYLAAAAQDATITSLEGSLQLLGRAANHNFDWADQIEYINGAFQQSLDLLISKERKYDVIYIDGGHSSSIQKKLIPYYLGLSEEHTCWIVDDIYWSKDMTQWWDEIRDGPRWNVVIDLYHFGILMNKPEFKEKIYSKILPIQIRWKPGVVRH